MMLVACLDGVPYKAPWKNVTAPFDVKVEAHTKRQMKINLDLPDTPLYDKKYLKEFQISMHVLYPDFEGIKLKKK